MFVVVGETRQAVIARDRSTLGGPVKYVPDARLVRFDDTQSTILSRKRVGVPFPSSPLAIYVNEYHLFVRRRGSRDQVLTL